MAKSKGGSGAVSGTKNLTFAKMRDTKGAVVYGECNGNGMVIDVKNEGFDAAVIGTLYIRKKALGGAMPEKINVTVAY